MNSTLHYLLPSAIDPEAHSVTINYQPLLYFLSLSANTLRISPIAYSDVGSHLITVSICDGFRTSNFSFSVIVTNSAPYFSVQLYNYTIPVNSTVICSLANIADLENNTITATASGVGLTGLPDFVSFSQPSFTFSPILFKDVDIHEINVTICDGYPLCTSEQFYITITNSAPYFMPGSLP